MEGKSYNSDNDNMGAGRAPYNRPDTLKKNNTNPIFSDKRAIAGLVMLFIPGLRIFGLILLLSRALKYMNFSGKNWIWIAFFSFLFFGGGLSEMFGWISNLVLPLTLLAGAVLGGYAFFKKRSERYDDYLSYIGSRDCVDMDSLMSAIGVSEAQLKRDIKSMRSRKLLPKSAYIDLGHRLVVINEAGRPAEAPGKATANENQAEGRVPSSAGYEKILTEIRRLNDEIDDGEMSAKIDHIEATTANIFHLVQQKPERAAEIQSFLEYYLPTTLKLLSRYAQLERQKTYGGENIRSSMQRIEGVMDKVVEGFDTQLDRLFKSDAIDITSEVNTLDKMMRMEGLAKK